MDHERESMIEFTKGDMFDSPADVRVNTVNCVGVMGAGVALAFKNRYPDMFKDYQNACRDRRLRPGKLHVWKNLLGEWVINFPTKRDWRDPSLYEDILSGLDALREYLLDHGHITVALPALGCRHGGLDWAKVAPMIKDKLADLEARILVFEPADSINAGRPRKISQQGRS
jgi:O-acetyl-ADP-ribose deacetylase (regulator of RNase III)